MRARNGIRVVTGAYSPRVNSTPRDRVWTLDKVSVWRYRSDRRRFCPPVVLFLGLVARSYVFDLRPGSSYVARLRDAGFDVYLIDWGVPNEADADLTFDYYVDEYLVRALEAVRADSGHPEVTAIAYCMGAAMALLLLGSGREVPVRQLVAITPPVDFRYLTDLTQPVRDGRIEPDDLIDPDTGLVPAELITAFTRMRQPTGELRQYINLWDNLWRDEEQVEGMLAVSRWAGDNVPASGQVVRQVIADFLRGNALYENRARIAGRPVRLSAITIPVLIVTAEQDEAVPPGCSRPLAGMLGSSDVEELRVPGGHVGLILGRHGSKAAFPKIRDWLERHSDEQDT
ncbi:MAG TPA: alpha/beta fold hydrolase [Candidatus Acidoferrum sp.]|nr:alpha/beta fold hydrolase [Candidatus Acidoferrum sp.]